MITLFENFNAIEFEKDEIVKLYDDRLNGSPIIPGLSKKYCKIININLVSNNNWYLIEIYNYNRNTVWVREDDIRHLTPEEKEIYIYDIEAEKFNL